MQSFHAQSSRSLLKTLEKIPVPIPPRGKGRTRKHTENWVIRYFLEAIAESGLLEYPLCVEHRERPDLVISSRIGKTGIEITEAVSEVSARVDALIGHREISEEMASKNRSEAHANSDPDDLGVSSEPIDMPDMRFVPPYRYGENRSLREIEDIARNRDWTQLQPHMGDSIECNWIEAMVCITKRKVRKLDLPGFAKYDRNWLLIYDNWSPAVPGHHKVAKPLARQLFKCEWRNPFEKIFILKDGQTVWEFSHDAKKMKLHGSGHFRLCELTLGEMES